MLLRLSSAQSFRSMNLVKNLTTIDLQPQELGCLQVREAGNVTTSATLLPSRWFHGDKIEDQRRNGRYPPRQFMENKFERLTPSLRSYSRWRKPRDWSDDVDQVWMSLNLAGDHVDVRTFSLITISPDPPLRCKSIIREPTPPRW